MTHLFRKEIVLAYPREEVFPFFSNAENLERLTPSQIGFQILTPTPIEMKPGALIDYRLRLFGVPVNWKTRISVWNPPHEFVDEQLQGPYREWVHTHRFQEEGGTTRMTDEVRYRLPLSPLGEVAYPFVRFQVGRIFAYRERALREVFPDPGQGAGP